MWLDIEVEVAATTDEFKDYNAEAEHVCLLNQLSPHCVFWGKVASVKSMHSVYQRRYELVPIPCGVFGTALHVG